MSKSSICIASADSLVGQAVLKYCAVECWKSFESMSCIYNRNDPAAFHEFFSRAFAAMPEAKLSVSAQGLDYTDMDQTVDSFRGCDYVIVCPPDGMESMEMKRWCDWIMRACIQANVGQILCVSCMGCDNVAQEKHLDWQGAQSTSLSRWFDCCEQVCRLYYPQCDIIRHAFLYQWFASWTKLCQQRRLFEACWGKSGEGSMSCVDVDDVARMACRLVCHKYPASGKVWQCCGPECLDGAGVADAFAKSQVAPGCTFKSVPVDVCRKMMAKFVRMEGMTWTKCTMEQCCTWMVFAASGHCGWQTQDLKLVCGNPGMRLTVWLQTQPVMA